MTPCEAAQVARSRRQHGITPATETRQPAERLETMAIGGGIADQRKGSESVADTVARQRQPPTGAVH